MTCSHRSIRRVGAFTLGLGLAAQALMSPAPLLAQPMSPPPSPSAAQTLDPPGRVARLAEASGQVWVYSPDAGEWLSAPRNQPLTSGDRLATDADGRAELRIGSTTLRLDGGAELEVARLDDEHIALRLHAGSLAVRLRTAEAVREFELATVEGRFTARRPGRYRIDRIDRAADRRGVGESSTLTVFEGEAVFEGTGSALTVYPNQRADFRREANGTAVQYAITEALADDFARWSGERDRDDDRVAAGAYASRWVSPEMTGAEELDRNGRWEQDAEYGALWIPRAVPTGWAPYAVGRWTWVRPWGWTWVDDAPWGFAPFHYGRWLYRGSTWCWAPGSYVQRPVYAPALVVWLGGGGGRPDRPGDRTPDRRDGRRPEPSIGWFPLAPREAYVPAYRVSARYARDVNGGHGLERPRADDRRDPRGAAGSSGSDFRNRQVPKALTVLPESALLQRPPGGVPTAPWRQVRGGREDERSGGSTGRDGVEGGRRAGDPAAPNRQNAGPTGPYGVVGRAPADTTGEPAAALSPIAAPPAPLPLTSPNRPTLRAEPGRPAWPRGGYTAGGGQADDALRRPAPGSVPQPQPAAVLRSPAAPAGNLSPPPAARELNSGLPAPSPHGAAPSPDGAPASPNGASTSPMRNGAATSPAPNGLPPMRDRRTDDAAAPRAGVPAVPVSPVGPMAPTATSTPMTPVTPAAHNPPVTPTATATPAAPAWQGRPAPAPAAEPTRDGFPRREFPRVDPSSPLERRDFPRQDRGEDRRVDRPDERRDVNPLRRDERRPGLAAPALAVPAPVAAPLPMQPAVIRPPAAPAVQAVPLQAPAPAAQLPPPGAAAPQPRPLREAVRPAPPVVAVPLPAPPPADDIRRAMPVNRAPPDDPRGPPGAAQREQRQSR